MSNPCGLPDAFEAIVNGEIPMPAADGKFYLDAGPMLKAEAERRLKRERLLRKESPHTNHDFAPRLVEVEGGWGIQMVWAGGNYT